MRVAALQFPVLMDVAANLGVLRSLIAQLEPDTLAVAPEGALSGYRPQAGLVQALNNAVTRGAIEAARQMAATARIHLIVGACVQDSGVWRNASFCMGPDKALFRYDKINLAQSERADFTAGDALPVFDLSVGGDAVRLGVQMCREIRYPEQWRWLALQGAQVIAYVNNAVSAPDGYEVWRAHVISRAAETQRFVIGANNAASDPLCPSLIVTPSGKVLAQAAIGQVCVIQAEIDLSQVSDWVIGQARGDVVDLRGDSAPR